MSRLSVTRTAKMLVGGELVRSESGRTVPVGGPPAGGQPAGAAPVVVFEVPLASRKDARDGVAAARKAAPGWSSRTPYNRGQVLYRFAEMADARLSELASAAAEDPDVVAGAVDLWVSYAGWPDKLAQVLGSPNAVSGPFSTVTAPVPVGVVAAVAPGSGFAALSSVAAPVLAAGCVGVVVVPPAAGRLVEAVGEICKACDLPAGALNIITGADPAVLSTLAAHLDVDALDLSGVTDRGTAASLEAAAAAGLTRVRRPDRSDVAAADLPAGRERLVWLCEQRTFWHPLGR